MYTLLIADDEQLERQALRFIIEKNYPQVQIVGEAGDGASAVRLAMEERPDIVLMDIRMPEMDGTVCTKYVKEKYPNIKVIILTTFDDDDFIFSALKYGASGYLLKGVEPAQLYQANETVYRGRNVIKLRH